MGATKPHADRAESHLVDYSAWQAPEYALAAATAAVAEATLAVAQQARVANLLTVITSESFEAGPTLLNSTKSMTPEELAEFRADRDAFWLDIKAQIKDGLGLS